MNTDGWPAPIALAGLALLLAVESGLLIGVFLPAASTVMAIGVATLHGFVPVWAAILVAAAASATGSSWGHTRGTTPAVGRHNLRELVVRRVGQQRYERLLVAFGRRPVLTLALCQCFGLIRTVAPRLSGPAGIGLARHVLATAPAALIWATGLVFAGRMAGTAYESVERAVGLAGPLAACLLLAVLGMTKYRRRLARHPVARRAVPRRRVEEPV